MPRKVVGRAAGWIGRGIGGTAMGVGRALDTRPGRGLLYGGAAVAGVGAALFDKDGPWRGSIIPNVQEAAFGDPSAIQNVSVGGAVAALGSNGRETRDPHDFYYGEPVNVQGMVDRGGVDGSLVFGMYNLRR